METTEISTDQENLMKDSKHCAKSVLICTYRNYWNRSRPCIILDSKIPRLVLEAFPKVLFLRQFFLDPTIQTGSKKVILIVL